MASKMLCPKCKRVLREEREYDQKARGDYRVIEGGKNLRCLACDYVGSVYEFDHEPNPPVEAITSFRGDNSFLSNFYPAKIKMGGVEYPTVEHAFQAAKSQDAAERDLIRRAPTSGEAKRRGRAIKLRKDWEKIKYELMEKLVREKFKDKVLSGHLLATRDAEIIEGNTWGDTTWGAVQYATKDRWVGKNALGKILMKIREELRAPKVDRNIIV